MIMLVNALLHKYKKFICINGFLRPGIVHRIDKETSGLLIIAKNNCTSFLSIQFSEHTIKKVFMLSLGYN